MTKDLNNLRKIDTILVDLANKYINDENITRGIITEDWINKLDAYLHLENAFNEKDIEYFKNLRYLIVRTLGNEITILRLKEDRQCFKYQDCMSAFVGVMDDYLFRLGALY